MLIPSSCREACWDVGPDGGLRVGGDLIKRKAVIHSINAWRPSQTCLAELTKFFEGQSVQISTYFNFPFGEEKKKKISTNSPISLKSFALICRDSFPKWAQTLPKHNNHPHMSHSVTEPTAFPFVTHLYLCSKKKKKKAELVKSHLAAITRENSSHYETGDNIARFMMSSAGCLEEQVFGAWAWKHLTEFFS